MDAMADNVTRSPLPAALQRQSPVFRDDRNKISCWFLIAEGIFGLPGRFCGTRFGSEFLSFFVTFFSPSVVGHTPSGEFQHSASVTGATPSGCQRRRRHVSYSIARQPISANHVVGSVGAILQSLSERRFPKIRSRHRECGRYGEDHSR